MFMGVVVAEVVDREVNKVVEEVNNKLVKAFNEGLVKVYIYNIKHRKNCECCHHHSVFKGHNVIVHIVFLNCQKCNHPGAKNAHKMTGDELY